MADSPYRIPLSQFERETPRVHARPVDPDDPDGELAPGTAFAMVEQPEPAPDPFTVEGLIVGIGKMGRGARTGDTTVGRRAASAQRWLVLLIALPFVIAILVDLLH